MIAEIKITGNRHSYQLKRISEYIEVKLAGNFSFATKTPIDCFYGGIRFQFDNRQHLFQFSEEIRGASFNKLILLLLNRGANISFGNKELESGLLKSIFLIYYWIELPLTAPKDSQLEKKIYDEFVVDWTNQPEPQKDIYFIKEKYCSPDYQASVNKLIDLNLLAKLEIAMADQTLVSYFIPLFKPGVSRELFATPSDIKGDLTYSLWKQILNERDVRISQWANNRF